MPEAVRDTSVAGRWQKLLVAVLGLVVVVHSVLLMLWLAPEGPVRDSVGDSRLSAYVDPYFQQQRDMIGPGAQRVDERLEIRVLLRAEGKGEPTTTPWVDLTGLEQKGLRDDVDPARIDLAARRLATNLNRSMFGLTPEQRTVAAEIVAKDDDPVLRGRLLKAADRPEAVEAFMTDQLMAARFASLFASARWGRDVVQVQLRIGRRTVPSFADRDDARVRDEKFATFFVGWRPGFRGSESAREAFDGYVG